MNQPNAIKTTIEVWDSENDIEPVVHQLDITGLSSEVAHKRHGALGMIFFNPCYYFIERTQSNPMTQEEFAKLYPPYMEIE